MHRLEIVVAVTMGVVTIGAFITQVITLNTNTTGVETALYNCLQFILSVGFAWFSTRAISRNEFEESLKRFAISAYRRIDDIERIVKRLRDEVDAMMAEATEHNDHELRIVQAIVSDTVQVVRSSIADWADVIGDELLTIEKIKRLEQEKGSGIAQDTAEKTDSAEADFRNVEGRIAKLISTLPPNLQLNIVDKREITRNLEHAARWISERHDIESGLSLTVVTGDEYFHQRDYLSLKPHETLHTVEDADSAIDVVDHAGLVVGRLQNNSPLDYPEFAVAFTKCYGNHPIELEFVEAIPGKKFGKVFFGWFNVKVKSEPKVDRKRSRQKRKTIASQPDDAEA